MLIPFKRMSFLLIFAVLLLTVPVCARRIRLYADDSTPLANRPVSVMISDESGSVSFNTISDEESSIEYNETKGILKATIILDDVYTGRFILESQDDFMILRKTAKISGFVTDEKDNMLQHLRLRIICSALTHSDIPEETDELGFFSIDEVGFGTCDIGVIKDGKIITHHQVINESKQYVIHIKVRNEKENTIWLPLILAIAILMILVLIFLRFKQLSPKRTKSDKTKKNFSNRQNDLLKTLSEKEREVITFLFFEGSLTQSQLRHKTGLPKSSLHRTLEKLENKNLAVYREYDGLKRIELSDFFMK